MERGIIAILYIYGGMECGMEYVEHGINKKSNEVCFVV